MIVCLSCEDNGEQSDLHAYSAIRMMAMKEHYNFVREVHVLNATTLQDSTDDYVMLRLICVIVICLTVFCRMMQAIVLNLGSHHRPKFCTFAVSPAA